VDTLKTAVIVVLLLAVVYGAYVVLSKPDDTPLPQEIAWHEQKSSEPLQIEMGKAESQPAAPQMDAGTAKFDSMWSAENKATEPKPLVHADASSNLTVPKPSAAGPAYSVPPAGLGSDKFDAGQKLAVPSDPASVAAPNLLGSASPSETKSEGDAAAAKSVANSGLPSLPELRSTPIDNKSPADAATIATADSATANANEPSRPSATDGVPPGTPDPALGPIGESAGNVTAAHSVTTSSVYDAALREAKLFMDDGKLHSALFTLSKFVHSPDLSPDQNNQLYDLLDPLAAKVVYSSEYQVEPAYEVRRGDRLSDVAQTYQVPWELLANINAVENPDVLVPGTKLKVLRGPFRADVDLQKNELTLFAGQMYAGRFPISVGKDPVPKPGEYRILEKQPGRVYYAGDGRTIAAEDATNPYGRVWLGLGNELSIHSSPEGGDSRGMGCISLSPLDATDVSCILSEGSSVVIRR
jgi:lipoprotein-anchoring transpeptidase ErfK/SrfK